MPSVRFAAVYRWSATVLLGGLVALHGQTSQTVDIGSGAPTGPDGTSPVLPQDMANYSQPSAFDGNQAVGAEPMYQPYPNLPSPFAAGPFIFRPHASYQYTDARGILASAGDPVNTVIQSYTLGLLTDIGRVWSIDYHPVWTDYSSKAYEDTTDQYLHILGVTQYDAWSFQLTQDYSKTDNVLVSTAHQTPVRAFATDLTAGYSLNSVTQIDMGLSQSLVYTSGLPTERQWFTQDSIHYSLGMGWDAFAEAILGYATVTPGDEVNFNRFVVGTDWKPDPVFTFTFQAGAELTNIINGPNFDTATFSGIVSYEPISGSKVSLTTSRETNPSNIVNGITRTTQVNLDLQQRILGRFFATAGVGAERSNYIAIPSAVDIRDDNYATWELGLGATVIRRLDVELRYEHARNNSTVSGYSFRSGQYEASVSLSY